MQGMTLHIDGLEEAVRKVLREMAPAEAKALAGAAADVPGLDELAIAALADWLEERGMADVGARVRKLPLRDGDLLILQPTSPMGREQLHAFSESCRRLHDSLQAAGRNIDVIPIQYGINLTHLRTGKREGT